MKISWKSIALLSLMLSISSSYAHTAKQASAPIDVNQATRILHKKTPSLKPQILKMALSAYDEAYKEGKTHKPILAIIDYTKPSDQRRLWIVDLRKMRVPYNTYVAHGKNSGVRKPTSFSNKRGSHKSALGVFVTGNTYQGHNGLSLRLNGLEKGINSQSARRGIVMHGAYYVSAAIAQQTGRIGRSWGCPAISQKVAKPVLNTLKDGALLFAYYPNQYWLSHSTYF